MLQHDVSCCSPTTGERPYAHTMKLSIIIPAFNEQETLEAVVRRIQAVDLGQVQKEIIVVNDASTDRTQDIMKHLTGIVPISHPVNVGKGGALTTGIKAATGDIVLFRMRISVHPTIMPPSSPLSCRDGAKPSWVHVSCTNALDSGNVALLTGITMWEPGHPGRHQRAVRQTLHGL